MSQQITVRPAGLWLLSNDLDCPDGALSQADDVVISRDGIVEPRRGHSTVYTLGASNFAWLSSVGTIYTSKLVGLLANGSIVAGTVSSWSTISAAGLSSTGSRADPSPSFEPLPAAAAQALFVPVARSIQKVDPGNNAYRNAGVPPGLDMSYTLSASGTPVALPNNTQVAYRMCWGKVDGASGARILGAPSPRLVVTNTAGGTRDVTLTITVPQDYFASANGSWGPTSGDFFQVYRTASTAYVANTSDPGEEMGLVYESTWTSGSSITFTDNVTDGLLGASGYWCPTQEGLTQTNNKPPISHTLAQYRGCLFFGSVFQPPNATIKILGTGAGAFNVGDTITIGGVVVTGGAAENLATNTCLVDTASATVSAKLANTAASIIRVVNRGNAATTGNGIANYAISLDAGTPNTMTGQIATIAKFDSTFTTSSASPGVRITALGGGWQSFVAPNALMWSKQNQPEAVPTLNVAYIGSSSKYIRRVVATRDSLFIFKEDGLWRLTGDSPPWTIQPFDPTCILVGDATAAALDNSVCALTRQGVVRVTDTGVQLISRPIEPVLRALIQNASLELQWYAIGVAYESDHKYRLHLPNAAGDTQAKQAYVYDLLTETWTRDTRACDCAVVDETGDLLYLANGLNLLQERKTLTDADFADGASQIAPAWTFTPRIGGNPARKHHFTTVNAIYRSVSAPSATLGFATDLVPAQATVAVDFTAYGTLPLGATSVRTWTPLEQSRGSQLKVSISHPVNGKSFAFQALGVEFRTTNEEAGS